MKVLELKRTGIVGEFRSQIWYLFWGESRGMGGYRGQPLDREVGGCTRTSLAQTFHFCLSRAIGTSLGNTLFLVGRVHVSQVKPAMGHQRPLTACIQSQDRLVPLELLPNSQFCNRSACVHQERHRHLYHRSRHRGVPPHC